MPDLDFAVEGAEVVTFAVAPTLALKLRITDSGEEPVHAVMLDCQVRIEAPRRRYVPAERERLGDLFGDPSRWSQTLRSLLWTHASVNVPPFAGSVLVDLRLPCTYDFNVQVTKYFDSLEDGEVPLTLLFSGSIFFAGPGGAHLLVGESHVGVQFYDAQHGQGIAAEYRHLRSARCPAAR